MVEMLNKARRAAISGKALKPSLRDDSEMQSARAKVHHWYPERLSKPKPELPAEGTLRYMVKKHHLPPAYERKIA